MDGEHQPTPVRKKSKDSESVQVGSLGCFVIIVGCGIAYALYQWANQGFPKFWH